MARYILRYRGLGSKPDQDVDRVAREPETTILDSTSRMLLVEAPSEHIELLVTDLRDWAASLEQTYDVPDPRPRVKQSATKGAERPRRRVKRSSPA